MNKKKQLQKKESDKRLLFVLAGAIILASVFIAVIVLSTPAEPGPSNPNDTIRIGAIYNLNGSQSSLDLPSAQGARLAAQLINERGGIQGKYIILTVYDGMTNTSEIAAAAARLINEDHVQVLIGMSDSDMVLPAAQVAAQSDIVFITSGATSPHLPLQVPGYLYLSCYGDNTQAAVAAEFAKSDLHATQAFVITDSSMEYTRLLSEYFTDRFTSEGGTIVGTVQYTGNLENNSLVTIASGFGNDSPDVFFVACGPDNCGSVIHELRRIGITAPILGGDSMDSPQLIHAIGVGANQVYYTTHADISTASADPNVSTFIKQYYLEYGEMPTAFAALGYDTVNLAAQAVTGSADVRKELSAIKGYEGLTGTISYENQSQIPLKSVTLMGINNGTVSFIGERLPGIVPSP